MKSEAEVINDALVWLADEKGLYLWRLNETIAGKKVQGWGFVPGAGYRTSEAEGSTVLEAIQSRLATISKVSQEAKRKISKEAEKHEKVNATARGFLKNLEKVSDAGTS